MLSSYYGNNDIISNVLIKYSLKQIVYFMDYIIKLILTKETYDFEENLMEGFYLDELNFLDYLQETIDNSLNFIDNEIEEKKDEEKYRITYCSLVNKLQSLFIISLKDVRVITFICSDNKNLKKFSYSPKFNIKNFIDFSIILIDDFINNVISFEDISFYAREEWWENYLYRKED